MEALNETIIEFFLSLQDTMRYVFIFIMAFGEGLPVIGSFLPGGTIALLIGSLSEEGFINPWLAVHIIAIGSLVGDLIGFFFGRYLLHVPWVNKMVYHEKHQKKWDLFDRHAAIVIIFGKILPVIRSVPSLFAGARKMNVFRYIIFVLIGSYLWALGGIFGGKYLTQLFGKNTILVILGVLVVSGLIAVLSGSKNKNKE